MLNPTNDKEVELTKQDISDAEAEAIVSIIVKLKSRGIGMSPRDLAGIVTDNNTRFTIYQFIAKKQIEKIEKLGYHKGLPENIEWALNSGDGTYKP